MYTDSHAHLSAPPLLEITDELLKRATDAGIKAIVNICTDRASLEQGLLLAKRNSMVYNTAATTPHDVEAEGEDFFPCVMQAAEQGELVAIGETGLDYYYEHSPKKLQQKHLNLYLELAKRVKLPLVFHCREAFEDLFALTESVNAVLHCFTGTLDEAKRALDRGWYLSFSGIITFKKSEALREVARYVPLNRIFIETDAPYLAPQSKRGKVNEPAYVVETAQVIAAIKGITAHEVGIETSKNATSFFSLNRNIKSYDDAN